MNKKMVDGVEMGEFFYDQNQIQTWISSRQELGA